MAMVVPSAVLASAKTRLSPSRKDPILFIAALEGLMKRGACSLSAESPIIPFAMIFLRNSLAVWFSFEPKLSDVSAMELTGSKSPLGDLNNTHLTMPVAEARMKKFSLIATNREYRGMSATVVPFEITSSDWASTHSRRVMFVGLSKAAEVISGMVTSVSKTLFARVIPDTALTILLALLKFVLLRG